MKQTIKVRKVKPLQQRPAAMPAAKRPVFWQDAVFWSFITLLAVIVVLYMYAKSLLILLFVTLLLFILLDPLVQRLAKRLPHGLAVLTAIGVFLGVMVLLVTVIARTVVPDLARFAREFPEFIAQFDANAALNALPPEVAQYSKQFLRDAATFAVDMVKESIIPLIRTFSGIAEMIAVPFLTFYLLQDGRRIAAAIARLLPPEQVERLTPFFDDIGRVLGGYIRGQMIIALISGTVVMTAMTLFQLPYAPILALVSALSEFVPVIGSVVATVPGVLVGLTHSPLMAVQVLVFYTLLLKVNHNLVYPKVVGQAIKVHPLFIMVTILLFGHLFGIIGMLFAVPGVAVLRVWLLHMLGRRSE